MVARQWLGNLKGPKGDTGTLENVTATADAVHSDSPTVDVDVSGDPTNRSLQFNFHGLQGPKGDTGTLENVTAHVDGTFLEIPTVDVTMSGNPSNRSFDLSFKGLRGFQGDAAGFNEITATTDNTHSENPTITAELTGPNTAKDIHFDFKGFMGPPSDIFERLGDEDVGDKNHGIYLEKGVPKVTEEVSSYGGIVRAGENLSPDNATQEDNSSTGGKVIQVPAGDNDKDLASLEFDVPFGLYSVVVRLKSSTVGGGNELLSINAYAGTVLLNTFPIKESDILTADEWTSLGVGVNFKGTTGDKLKIVLKRGTYGGSGILSIDYLQVMTAPVAINALT